MVYFGLLNGAASWFGALSQLFYFANYYQLFSGSNGIPAGTGVLWSLAVEEHFYLIYPLLLLAFIRFRGLAQFPAALALLCAAALLWRFHLVAGPDFDPSRTFYASDTRFDSILYGAILALVSQHLSLTKSAGTSPLRMQMLAGFGLAGLLLSLLNRDVVFRETSRYSLQGICLMPIFFYAINVHDSQVSRFLNWSPLRRIGVYSYSIYLIHFVLLSLLPHQFAARTSALLLLAIVLGGSCLYAFLIDSYIDPYFRRLRKVLH
jgi:peptidoglycan/LPS O-acetylase OafA/YrhL